MAAEFGGYGALLRLYVWSFIDPFGALWFIYNLGLFMVTVRLVRNLPWQLVWVAAAALEIAPIQTGLTAVDEFAARFVYFYTGYLFAPLVFRFAARVASRTGLAAAGLAAWAVAEAALVIFGTADLPFVSLAVGFVGAFAVIAFSVLRSRSPAGVPLSWLGAHSLIIYLSFFFPMDVARTLLLKTGVFTDIGTASLLVTLSGITGSALFYLAVQRTGWGWWLFERPAWARIENRVRRPREALQPAE